MKTKVLFLFISFLGAFSVSAQSGRSQLKLAGTVPQRTDLLWTQTSTSLTLNPQKTPSLNIYIKPIATRLPSSVRTIKKVEPLKKLIAPTSLTGPSIIIVEAP